MAINKTLQMHYVINDTIEGSHYLTAFTIYEKLPCLIRLYACEESNLSAELLESCMQDQCKIYNNRDKKQNDKDEGFRNNIVFQKLLEKNYINLI